MKAPIMLLLGILLVSPQVFARMTRTVEKTFTSVPGADLTVETTGGDIRVIAGTGNEVKVTATLKIDASSAPKADQLQRELDLQINQQGDAVSVRAKYPNSGWHWGSWPPIAVSFTVSVPSRYNTSLSTSGGNIELADVSGRAHLSTSGGNLSILRVEGEVDGRTSGGNIVVESLRGQLTAITSGGNIRAGIDGMLKGDVRLSTSGGNVDVSVDKATRFDLRSHTNGGDIDASGLSIVIDPDGKTENSLSGKVNGGGPQLFLETSGGDIRIHAHR